MTAPGLPDGPPDLSVVVPTYHRPDRIVDLVRFLLAEADALAASGERIEIIPVVDGPDPAAEAALDAVKDPRVRPVVLAVNGGIANARREGTLVARGDVVVQIDDDVQPKPGTLAVHLAAHRADDKLVLLGHMPIVPMELLPTERVASDLYAKTYDTSWDNYLADPEQVLIWLWGGYVSARREHFQAAEDLMEPWPRMYHEDCDQGLRLRALGLHGRAEPAASSVHLHRRDLSGVLREAEGMGKGLAELQRRWGVELVPKPPYLAGGGVVNRVLDGIDTARLTGPVIAAASWVSRKAAKAGIVGVERRAIQLARRLVLRRSYSQALRRS